MRLELTLHEADQLRRSLAHALEQQHSEEEQTALQQLDDKVAAAQAQAARQTPCPVCQQLFTQETSGRTGRYCSAACKQKAYRQRRDQAKRRHVPRFSI
jgi:hypothetical protein